MGQYFRGWRRKVGVVTLLFAVLFMAGWIRSKVTSDMLTFQFFENFDCPIHCFESSYGCFAYDQIVGSSYPAKVSWESCPIEDRRDPWAPTQNRTWQWNCGLFELGQTADLYLHRYVHIPYWVIVTPLTLISIWLLISRPPPINAQEILPQCDECRKSMTAGPKRPESCG